MAAKVIEPKVGQRWRLVTEHGKAGLRVTAVNGARVGIRFAGEPMGMSRAWWNTLAAAGVVEFETTLERP